MQAYLYYVFDSPTMSDAEYDKLSYYVAEHWDQLDPVRQWQLGSPDTLRASGHHIRFTTLSVYGARSVYREAFNRPPPTSPPEEWREREDGLRFVTAV